MCRENNRVCDFSGILCGFGRCNFVAFYRCFWLNYRLLLFLRKFIVIIVSLRNTTHFIPNSCFPT